MPSQLSNPEKKSLSPSERTTAQTIRLDNLLNDHQIAPTEIAFVWSDTQGSEGAIIRTGQSLWQAGIPLWSEIEPSLIQRQDNLERFCADAARYFAFYIPSASLQTQGINAQPLPIATLLEFAKRYFGTHTDVLFLPR